MNDELEYKKQRNSVTDCRKENGITVGLIDGIIAIARVLRKRNLQDDEVREALKDFQSDEDIDHLINFKE